MDIPKDVSKRLSPSAKPAPTAAAPTEPKPEPAPKRTAPQVFYGPGDVSKVFQPDEDLPEGWEDHPRKVADFVDPAEPAKLDL